MTRTRKPDVLTGRLARREQRRAARLTSIDTARRLARVELELTGLHNQVAADSIVLGTAPDPAVITADTRRADEAALTALAARIWTPVELAVFAALKAEGGQR